MALRTVKGNYCGGKLVVLLYCTGAGVYLVVLHYCTGTGVYLVVLLYCIGTGVYLVVLLYCTGTGVYLVEWPPDVSVCEEGNGGFVDCVVWKHENLGLHAAITSNRSSNPGVYKNQLRGDIKAFKTKLNTSPYLFQTLGSSKKL